MCFTYFYAFTFVHLRLKNSWRPYKIGFLCPFALLCYAIVSFAYQQTLSDSQSKYFHRCHWISSSKVMLVCICKNTDIPITFFLSKGWLPTELLPPHFNKVLLLIGKMVVMKCRVTCATQSLFSQHEVKIAKCVLLTPKSYSSMLCFDAWMTQKMRLLSAFPAR